MSKLINLEYSLANLTFIIQPAFEFELTGGWLAIQLAIQI